jgi:hypothetical protein
MTLPSTSLAWLPTVVVVTSSAEEMGAVMKLTAPAVAMVAAAVKSVVGVLIFTVACS